MEIVQDLLRDAQFAKVRPKHKLDPRRIQIFRCVVAIIMLVNNFVYVFNEGETGFLNYLFFLTHWGNIFTTFYFTINSFMYYDRKMTSKLAIFYHVALAVETTVTFGFWFLVVPLAYMTFSASPRRLKYLGSTSRSYQIYMNIYLHSFPLICLCIDYTFNRFVLSKRSLGLWISVIVTYFMVNFLAVVVFDYEIYVSLDYTQRMHYLIVLMTGMASLVGWWMPLWFQTSKYILKKEKEVQQKIIKD